MAFRIETRAIAGLAGLLLGPAVWGQASLRYEVWHGHSRVYSMPPQLKKAGVPGTLTITDAGISFEQKYEGAQRPKHPQAWRWDYQDIQQLKISPKAISVLTYKDNRWKLGADRQYDFDLVADGSFEGAYQVLKTRLDQRFVAAMAERPAAVLWEVPVKRLAGLGGDEGVLEAGAGEMVYRSAKKGASRTWRYEDIDNIASSGPFELTITTFERSRLDYGSRKHFSFSLKRPLEEGRYNDLWLRLNRSKGLKILSAYRQAGM